MTEPTEPADPPPLTDAEIGYWTNPDILTIVALRRQVTELTGSSYIHLGVVDLALGTWRCERNADAVDCVHQLCREHALVKRIANLTARNAELVEALTEANGAACAETCEHHDDGTAVHTPECVRCTDALAKAQEGA